MKRRWALIVSLALIAGCNDKDDPQKPADKAQSRSASGSRSPARPARPGEYSAGERRALLTLARRTLTAVVSGKGMPTVNPDDFPAKLKAERGCFVTLNKNGRLRGCKGYIPPVMLLYKAVMESARSAALEDTRFLPVRTAELNQIEIEISVLTVPKPMAFTSLEDLLAKLRPHVDGVVFEARTPRRIFRSVFLPQVWEKIPDKKDFMTALAKKARLPLPDWAWKPPDVKIQTYQAEYFHE